MKLKCDRHNRRVIVLPETKRVVHRTGDGSACSSLSVSMKAPDGFDKTWSIHEFLNEPHIKQNYVLAH